MISNLPALVSIDKVLFAATTWIQRGPDTLEFAVSLEDTDGVVIEGLTLRGPCKKIAR
jgi:hypothetical protein